MESKRGFSIEGGIGMGVALLSSLIPTDSPGWRICVLVLGGLLLEDAVRKSEWVKEKHPVFSVIKGFVPNESESRWRVILATLLVIIGIAWYGIATWPPRVRSIESHTLTVPSPTGERDRIGTTLVTTKEPIAHPKVPAKPNPVSKPKGNEKPKPRPIPAAYPIVFLSGNNVIYDSGTGKITINLSIANTTATEVNVHVKVYEVAFRNGVAISGPINSSEKDLGLAGPPATQNFTVGFNVSPEAKQDYESGILYLMVYVIASYPDRNGTTTYHYQGRTIPKSTTLDEQSSGWDGPQSNGPK